MNVLALAGDAGGARVLSPVMKRLATQPGVTLQDNEIHIRGGRADDTMFVVDGMSVNDPLAGGGYGYQIDPSIINEIEVLTGGFNAEHGQAIALTKGQRKIFDQARAKGGFDSTDTDGRVLELICADYIAGK